MNEHEKLKQICDKIWYEPSLFTYNKQHTGNFNTYLKFDKYNNEQIVDVREIIFTQEFMKKFEEYTYNIRPEIYLFKRNHGDSNLDVIMVEINLDNPVDYLYNLIK